MGVAPFGVGIDTFGMGIDEGSISQEWIARTVSWSADKGLETCSDSAQWAGRIPFTRGLKFKIWCGVSVTLLLGFLPLWTYQYRSIRADSIADALAEARTLSTILKGSGQFFHRTLIDSGVPMTGGRLNLLPIHTMVRFADELPSLARLGRVQLRVVGSDRGSAVDLPNSEDRAAFQFFARHPEAEEFQVQTRGVAGDPQLYYAQPIWSERACLLCHGVPEQVPDWIRERSDVSLGHHEGDLRAILSLQLASRVIDQRTRELFIGTFGIGLLILVLLALVLSLLIQHLVINRLSKLRRQIRRLTDGACEANVSVAGQDELADLAAAFNEMATRVQARERELSDSEHKLKLFIDHAPAALAMFDRDMRYLAVSRRWAEDNGLAGQSIIGRTYDDVCPGAPQQWRALHRRGLAGEVIRRDEEVSGPDDGGKRWLHWEIHPWYQSGGQVEGVVIFCEDLTARKAAEDVLNSANRYHRGLLEASLDALVVIDRDGHVTDVNSATERLTGVDRQQLLGTEFAAYFAESEQAREGCLRAFRDGNIRDFPLRLRHCNGWSTPVLYNASVCRSEKKGDVLFAAARDVTALQQISQLLEARLRLLERLENSSLDDVMLACLDEAAALTGSQIAFYQGQVAYHATSRFQTWSNPALDALCQSAAIALHAMLLQSGVWVACVKSHQPIINQDGSSLPARSGPRLRLAGIANEMIVPVLRHKRLVAVLGVGNKARDFNEWDLRVATTLADLAWDMIQRKHAAEQLRASENRYRRIVETAREGVWIIDQDYRTSFVNARMAKMLDLDADQLLGRRVEDFLFGGDIASYQERLLTRISGTSEQYEQRLRRSDGSACWVLVSAVPIVNDEGQFDGVLRMITDIGPLKAQQQRLEQMAHYDALTGLPNRVLFADRLQVALAMARREEQLLAIGYLDLDKFKPVNDTHGHAVGDRLLTTLANRITGALREGDTVARVGGDEFTLLLGGLAGEAQAEQMLARLQSSVAQPFSIDETTSVEVSASIGYTLYPLDPSDPDTLMRHADLAMYQAKQAGRRCVCRFDPVAQS